jgi:hypothetical protein
MLCLILVCIKPQNQLTALLCHFLQKEKDHFARVDIFSKLKIVNARDYKNLERFYFKIKLYLILSYINKDNGYNIGLI